MSNGIYIPQNAVQRLVEDVMEEQDDVANVNYCEVTTKLTHGDQEIFAVNVYVDTEDEGSELREVTVAIDMRTRKS